MRVNAIPYECGGSEGAHPGSRMGCHVIDEMIRYGNPSIPVHSMHKLRLDSGLSAAQMAETVAASSQRLGKSVWIGGDHTATYGVLKGFSEPFDLYVIDAHGDSEDGPLAHDTWLHHALKDTPVDRVIMFGVRTPMTHRARVSVLRPGEYLSALTRMHEHKRKFYISIDIDGFDPTVAPGTGNPVYGGIVDIDTWMRAIGLAYKSRNCLGLDIMEYNPLLDPSRQTAHLILNMLGDIYAHSTRSV